MDPTACYRDMLASLQDGDIETAREYALNLRRWLDRGGFLPGGGKLRKSAIVSFCTWVTSTYPAEE